MDVTGRNKRQIAEHMGVQLELERSSFISTWRDIGENVSPSRPRFMVTESNRGQRRNQKIINSTASLSLRTLRSGMMGGITSPARPWFKLSTQDDDLNDYAPVKAWLYEVTRRMSTVFLRSNLYNMLPLVYGDLGTFGTAPISVEEDYTSTIRTLSFPIGSYHIAKDFSGRVNTFMRTFKMTVAQVVEQFGQKSDKSAQVDWSNISDFVKDQYERSNYQTWVIIRHLISPNPNYDSKKSESKFKRFQSIYYERGVSQGSQINYAKESDGLLRESGYDHFPILCPRWEVTGEDVYGTDCPGILTIGDVKALSLMEKRKAMAIEKMVNPPMVASSEMKGNRNSILPGDVTYLPSQTNADVFRSAHNVNLDLNHLQAAITQHENRIRKGWFEDLFLMMADSDRRQITATEIDERKEEKLLALGPVLEQVNQDLLDPLIDNVFDIMIKRNLMPKAPKELHGQPLRVEYVSVMAQAQKMIGLSSVDHFLQFVGNFSKVSPDILPKINFDEVANVYADFCAVPPKLLRSDEDAQNIRQNQAQAQAQEQQQQQMAVQAQSAKNLSQADTSGPNALTQLMQQAQAGNLVQGA